MILIGQYDSPFVRRVGIALTLYGRAFEHRPWSAWGDAERLRSVNPLTRVPVLLLDDGEVVEPVVANDTYLYWPRENVAPTAIDAVLEDGTVLTDNAGIAAWAEAFKPDPPLFGTTPADKAEKKAS